MPGHTVCLGCETQKRSANDKFFSVNSATLPLIFINNVRQIFNTRKRKLDTIDEIPQNSKVCKSCYQLNRNPIIFKDLNQPDLTIYRKGLNSHHSCTFGCQNSVLLIGIPQNIRRLLLMNYKFLALPDARMCSEHIGTDNYWPFVNRLANEVPPEDQRIVCDLMFEYYHDNEKKKDVIFDISNINSMNDEDFKAWFAFDKQQFSQICEYTKNCGPKQIAILLCKLRTSLSNQQLGFLFGCTDQTISNQLSIVRKDLILNLVPKFINTNDRSELLKHNTPMAKTLFDIPGNATSCIFDATYRFAHKSKNYSGQKQLWSEQKKMPLVKPMVGCAPDGYVLFVLGPYDATHNDATILQDCFVRYEDVMSTLQEGDHIFVDRGFRDSISYLTESKKFYVHCPGLGELETDEANESRFVTKVRWIIEQLFGRLKMKFKYFVIAAHNATLNYDYEYLLIAFALLNLFHKPIFSDKEHEDIARLMKSRKNVPNRLKIIVQEYNLSKVRVPYIEVNYTLMDNRENNQIMRFPQLSMDDLYTISLGPYKINNAVSYYAEHLNEGIFLVHKFEPNARHRTASVNYAQYGIRIQDPLLVKAYMKSRFRSGKNHHIFVLVDKTKQGKDCIAEYYCTCESGSRTVGCCSHIMTIIWFLGYGQYSDIKTPNPDICNVSITIPKLQCEPEIEES